MIHNVGYDTHFVINQLANNLRVNLTALEKIWKNVLLFWYQLKKKT